MPRGRVPSSPLRPDETRTQRKSRKDRERRIRRRENNDAATTDLNRSRDAARVCNRRRRIQEAMNEEESVSFRLERATRERERLQAAQSAMNDQEQAAFHLERANRERERLQAAQSAMNDQEQAASRLERATRERVRYRQLDQNQLRHHSEMEAARVSALTDADRAIFNERNRANQVNYRHNQGPRDIDESFAQYISDFTNDVKMPLENHPFVQEQQQQFRDEMAKFEMRYCYICQERWPTNQNLHLIEKYPPNNIGDNSIRYYQCSSCKRDRGNPKLFSKENDMIPLTLASGSIEELQECIDASPLERMLCARACTVMRVVRHQSGNLIYQGHSINFVQDFAGFFRTGGIPRMLNNVPYLVLVKHGCNDEIIEVRVRRRIVKLLSEYYIDHIPGYGRLDEEALNALPVDGMVQDLVMYVDEFGDSSTTTAHNPVGNTDSTVLIPQRQELESDSIQNRVREIQQLGSSSSQFTSQESDAIEQRLQSLQTGIDVNETNWPQVGSQPLNEFTTENLMVMCFPELFMDGKGDPTNKVRLRDVTIPNAAKHLIKFCVKNNVGEWVYPFATHERVAGWLESMIIRKRIMSQANYCMRQNPELQHTTISELAAISRNEGGRRFVQNIYKYTSNISGSDPYWFQRRRELIAQAEQEGLKGTLFWTLSAADNHWKDIMKLLDVPEHASPEVKRQAVRRNPHIVDFYFCRRVERAAKHLFRKCLIADWLWYRYEFQMRGSAHVHGMMKLLLSPDILNMVSKVYAGNKAMETLEAMDQFRQMSDEEKLEFQSAASKDESINVEYRQCLAASLMSPEEVQHLNECIVAGTEAETTVIRFHKWLITTMNDDLPSIDDLSENEKKLKELVKERKLLLGKIAIQQVLGNDAPMLEQSKVEIENQISSIMSTFAMKKAQVLSDYGSTPVSHPHPCAADWNETRNSKVQYQKLLFVQRHKCVGTYCMRKKKRPDGSEYGQPYCRFGFPLNLQCTWSILFDEMEGGGVRANFICKRNDPIMSQHNKMHLQSWMANCDLQIVLDEEQAIRYMVKYASKPEKSSHHMNDIMQSILQSRNENDTDNNDEEESKEERPEPADDVTGQTLIRKVAMKSVGVRNKSQQEIMHSILQEDLYHTDFVYVNIHLDKYDVRVINNNSRSQQDSPAFYQNIFDVYANRDEVHNHLSFLKFCQQFEAKKGELVKRTKRTVVITFPSLSSDSMSQFYHRYCKFFLIKHKPWNGNVNQAWGGPIIDPNEGDEDCILDDNNIIAKQRYISQFRDFQQNIDTRVLEVVNADVNRLRRVRDECQARYLEEEEAVGAEISDQSLWMQMAGMAPQTSDAAIPQDLAPRLDPNIDWVAIRVTPPELAESAGEDLNMKRSACPNAQREIGDIDMEILNDEQSFAVAIVSHKIRCNERLLMTITGGPGTGKSTVIKGITKAVNSIIGNETAVLRMGTTGTAAFVISGATCHSVLSLPINRTYCALKGDKLRILQENLKDKKIIIIDEVSMLGKKMLMYIDKRLKEGSGKQDEPFGGFNIIFVGDFQQLPPIGDTPIYDGDSSESFLLYSAIEDAVVLQKSQRQQGENPDQIAFRRILSRCTETEADGGLQEEDWHVLQTRFIQSATDAEDEKWNDAPYMFHDNNSCFEYNMAKLQDIGSPITCIKASHNNVKAAKRDSSEAQNLQAILHLCVGSEVMLTSNVWTEVGLHNGAKGKVIDFVYVDASGPLSGNVPEAVVVQFHSLAGEDQIPPFLNDYCRSVAIPRKQVEWKHNGETLIRTQFPLMLSSAMTIHKSQGRTLDMAVIDLGSSEKCCGMSLVALSRVKNLNNILLKPFSFERLRKINKSKQLPKVQLALTELDKRFQATKERYDLLWNEQ